MWIVVIKWTNGLVTRGREKMEVFLCSSIFLDDQNNLMEMLLKISILNS